MEKEARPSHASWLEPVLAPVQTHARGDLNRSTLSGPKSQRSGRHPPRLRRPRSTVPRGLPPPPGLQASDLPSSPGLEARRSVGSHVPAPTSACAAVMPLRKPALVRASCWGPRACGLSRPHCPPPRAPGVLAISACTAGPTPRPRAMASRLCTADPRPCSAGATRSQPPRAGGITPMALRGPRPTPPGRRGPSPRVPVASRRWHCGDQDQPRTPANPVQRHHAQH